MSKELTEYLKQFEGREDFEKLKNFLEPYIGQGEEKKDIVRREDVECLLADAFCGYDEELMGEIIEYGTAHPEAPFWDFLKFGKTGLFGITMEEVMEDDE